MHSNSARMGLYNPLFDTEWDTYTLYDLAEWVNGLAFRKINFLESGKPVIKISELKDGITSQTKFTKQEFDRKYFLKKGDMLFSWSGSPETSIDVFWYNLPDGWLNQHIFKVTTSDSVSSLFFYYLLKYLKPNFIAIAKNKQTTGLGHVTKSDLEQIIVKCPTLKKQNKIASILKVLDDKIEVNNSINSGLEKLGETLFKRWFFDFEFPDENREPYRISVGAMKDSELGEIPETWTYSNLGEMIEITSGKRPSERNEQQTEKYQFPLYGASSIMGYVPSYLYDEPILIIGRVGTHGVVQRANKKSFPSDNTLVIKSKYYNFIYFILLKIDYSSLNVGTTQPLITQTSVKNIKILIPNVTTLDLFEEITSKLFSYNDLKLDENKRLSDLRNILLPRLMSGEIQVPVEAG